MEFGKYPKQSGVHVWPITHIQSSFFASVSQKQGLSPFGETHFQDFSIHVNFFTSKISMLILLTVCQTFHIFHLSLTDFQNFPGPVPFFLDFEVLENATGNKIPEVFRFSRILTNQAKRMIEFVREVVIPAMKSTGP